MRDTLASRRAVEVSPSVLRAACAAWSTAGWPDPTIWARVRVLRSALGWAHAERVLDQNPLEGMRGPPQPAIRQHAPVEAVRAILDYASVRAATAAEQWDGTVHGCAWLRRSEQVLLVVRLAADSGARRGELAALQFADLDGDVLTIARGTSNEIVGPTKTNSTRRLTLGATTAALWRDDARRWQQRLAGEPLGPWLFSPDDDHARRLTTSALGHWFAALAAGAIAGAALSYPILTLIASGSVPQVLLGFLIAMPLVQAAMYGTLAAFTSEMFATGNRYTGASLGYQLSTTLGGGFAPLIAASLVAGTRSRCTPSPRSTASGTGSWIWRQVGRWRGRRSRRPPRGTSTGSGVLRSKMRTREPATRPTRTGSWCCPHFTS